MKVRATRMGIHGDQRRRPGDIFEIEDDVKLGSWMEMAEETLPVTEPSFRARRGGAHGPAEEDVI